MAQPPRPRPLRTKETEPSTFPISIPARTKTISSHEAKANDFKVILVDGVDYDSDTYFQSLPGYAVYKDLSNKDWNTLPDSLREIIIEYLYDRHREPVPRPVELAFPLAGDDQRLALLSLLQTQETVLQEQQRSEGNAVKRFKAEATLS